MYTYVYSLQGDVLGLKDSSGTLVVTYLYDAWGKEISRGGTLSTTLGVINPFRYRGYVYDEETGLYYLRSRYYDPDIGRFISSDSILGQVGGLLQHNLFCYCGNEPISKSDQSGMMEDSLDGGSSGLGLGITLIATSIYFAIKTHNNDYSKTITSQNEITKSKTCKRHETELHHIVAQTDHRAYIGRIILECVGIDINSSLNVVVVSYEYHKHIHTNLYYVYVNTFLTVSYIDGIRYDDEKQKVVSALSTLKNQIEDVSFFFGG